MGKVGRKPDEHKRAMVAALGIPAKKARKMSSLQVERLLLATPEALRLVMNGLPAVPESRAVGITRAKSVWPTHHIRSYTLAHMVASMTQEITGDVCMVEEPMEGMFEVIRYCCGEKTVTV